MKLSILTLSLLCLSSLAYAEEYLHCQLIGQSDSIGSMAPKTVHIEESQKWTLHEDGVLAKKLRVRVTEKNIIATLLKKDRNDGLTRYKYIFDDSRCDSEQIGSATLSKKRVHGNRDEAPLAGTSIYECTCAVD